MLSIGDHLKSRSIDEGAGSRGPGPGAPGSGGPAERPQRNARSLIYNYYRSNTFKKGGLPMRTKDEILESEHRNSLKAATPKEISLIHTLLILEALIDIRDVLTLGLNQIVDLVSPKIDFGQKPNPK